MNNLVSSLELFAYLQCWGGVKVWLKVCFLFVFLHSFWKLKKSNQKDSYKENLKYSAQLFIRNTLCRNTLHLFLSSREREHGFLDLFSVSDLADLIVDLLRPWASMVVWIYTPVVDTYTCPVENTASSPPWIACGWRIAPALHSIWSEVAATSSTSFSPPCFSPCRAPLLPFSLQALNCAMMPFLASLTSSSLGNYNGLGVNCLLKDAGSSALLDGGLPWEYSCLSEWLLQ